MKQIESNDFDSFFLQMEREFGGKRGGKEKYMQETDIGFGFKADIPQEFRKADQREAAEIFWSEERPSLLFLTSDKRAGIAFKELEKRIGKKQWMERVRQIISKADDRTVFYGNGMIGTREGIPWLEFKSFASGGRVYNLAFFVQTEKRTFMGTFYCVFEDYTEWKAIVFYMLRMMEKRI